MSFTDDDLKRLREKLDIPSGLRDPILGNSELRSLLARLEAAEAYCQAVEMGIEHRDCDYPKCGKNWICNDCVREIEARETWRKEAGK